jgi:hypothetical protein
VIEGPKARAEGTITDRYKVLETGDITTRRSRDRYKPSTGTGPKGQTPRDKIRHHDLTV